MAIQVIPLVDETYYCPILDKEMSYTLPDIQLVYCVTDAYKNGAFLGEFISSQRLLESGLRSLLNELFPNWKSCSYNVGNREKGVVYQLPGKPVNS